MEVKELYSIEDKEYWIDQMKKSDWGAGQYLYELISKNELISFCTLAELDDIRDTDIGPWIGFVYTFPQYR